MDGEMLTTRELASMLGLKYSTVKFYRSRKPWCLPPAYKVTGHPMWKKSEVVAWINTKKEG